MKGSKLLRWSAIIVGCWLGGQAHAATGLAVICTAGATAGQTVPSNTCTATKYTMPTATDLVPAGANWDASVWKTWSTVATGENYYTCTTDVPNPTVPATPWSASTDPCKAWTFVPKVAAAVVNTTGTLTLAWSLPTQNTDGTALTDLAGVWIYSGSPLVRLKQIAKPATTTTLTGYKDGTYQFAATAITTAGVESAQVGPVAVTVKLPVIVPNPPTPLTVSETTAYRYDQAQADKPRLFAIGTVPLKTVCDEKTQVMGFYRVPRSAVTFSQGASANIPLAKCG